jgi:hypothetical protein
MSVRVTVTGATAGSLHTVSVYVCLTADAAMRKAGGVASLAADTLRIWNDRGEWAPLEPLPALGGRSGVRIAVVNSASATILLRAQLRASIRQAPGDYRGILIIEAQDQ